MNCASLTQTKAPPPSYQNVPHHRPAAVGPQHSVWLWGWWTGRTAAPRSPPHPLASTYPAAPEPAWPPGEGPSSHTWGTLSEPTARRRRRRRRGREGSVWSVQLWMCCWNHWGGHLPSPAWWGNTWTSTLGPVLQRSAAWSEGSSQLSVGVEKSTKFQ